MGRGKFAKWLAFKYIELKIISFKFQMNMTSKRKLQAAFDFNEMRLTALIFKQWRAVNDRESNIQFKKDLEAIKHHRRYLKKYLLYRSNNKFNSIQRVS